MVTTDGHHHQQSTSKTNNGSNGTNKQQQQQQHEAAPYERVVFNGSVYRDERTREMLFGGVRAQLNQQQQQQQPHEQSLLNSQPSTSLMRAAQLPNQRRQTAIGIQATSSSSGSENDSASYSQSQLASNNSRPPPPPPLSLQTSGQNALAATVGDSVPRPPPQQDHRISAVLHAISNGRVSMLRSIWSADLPLYVDEHKNTVLHWCAKYEGAAKCLKWLLKNTQVPLNSRNFRGELCTHVAARHGVLSCLKVALMSANMTGGQGHSSEGAGGSGGGGGSGTDRLFSATEKDKRGFTILHLAVIKQRFPIVRWLTKQTFSALLVRIADNNNNLPLHYAALRGSKKMAQLLLKKNKDMLNLRNISGATPLHVAAFEGRSVAFVQWLVEEVGADATAVMESGVNLLHVSAAGGNIAVVRYLLSTTRQAAEAVLSRSQDGSTIFHFSAANGHAHLLQWLWAQRGNASSRTGHAGFLPPSSSSGAGSNRASPLTTALAAGIHLRNTLGNSPAHAAADAGQASTFRLLVEFGADIFGKNKAGFSALELALANKNPVLVRLAEDIRRLLLDPTLTASTVDQQDPKAGHHHQSPVVLAQSMPMSYQSTMTSSYQTLNLPGGESHHQQQQDHRLQMQLHIATGELGLLDGGNENEDDAVDNNNRNSNEAIDGEELFVVRRVNENVFLKQGSVPQQQQQQQQQQQKTPQSQSQAFTSWRDRIFPQIKGRRGSNQSSSSSTGNLQSVPELTTLMAHDQRLATSHHGSSSGGGGGQHDDYWDRLSNDIRRLLVLRRYP